MDINFHWNQRTLKFCQFCRRPIWKWHQWTIKISFPFFSSSIFSLVAILVGSRDHRTQFWKGPSKDHSIKVWLQLAQCFLRRRLKCEMLTDKKWCSHGLKARWAKNGFSLKKNHFTMQISKWFASYWHFDRENRDWSDRGSRSESVLVVF